MRLLTLSIALVVLICVSPALAGVNSLVVHEWGTFTSLQDERGRTVGGINADVESLPSFVEDLFKSAKGFPFNYPQVTMRLETPVVYFHLPAGSGPMKLTFSAKFRRGLLTQWYPMAATDVSREKLPPFNGMTPADISTFFKTSGNTLTWKDFIAEAAGGTPAATDSSIWLAPRKVNAADVTVNSQTERYLFYRGLGELDAPLRAERIGDELSIRQQINPEVSGADQLKIGTRWYLDVQPDGRTAFRKLDGDDNVVTTLATFVPSEYRSDAQAELRADTKKSLVGAGLFDDEADAMLNTWEQAYFKSPGSRIFFIVPRPWTDYYLPIKLSAPAKIERVMVGRVDLITPWQRELAVKAVDEPAMSETFRKQMGRFADAIIQNEADRRTRVEPISRSN